ncbi:hypothetical protein QAD02_003040 [Eretmocerus hayati]|uniref:Uncharacterized protein n=1 Tax=Eretmocerus hayati TaxID=131215 RepID=A0ACC2NKZ5_9HYME|nr:hypothetical protein QAD02_003040 [Eretmocerus hayati]
MLSADTSPTNSPKFTRRRVASLGASNKDILSYMQVKTSGKRQGQERSPESKADTIVKRKYIVKSNAGREFAPEKDIYKDQKQTEGEQQRDIKDMEELRKLISTMHEDMKNMEGKMMGRMDTLMEELKTENERRAEERDKRITNLEIKGRERGDARKEIEERLEHLEGFLPKEGGTYTTGGHQAQSNPEWRELKRRLEENGRRAKRNNLVIIGKRMEQTRLKERVEKWLEEQLQVSCRVIRAWKIRSPKEEMINVFIEKDLTWQEREIRRKLVGFAKEQAGKGKKTLARSGRGQKQAAEKKMKIIAWNIAGAKNISLKAWGYLKEFVVIFLAETWLEVKEEAGIRSKLGEYDITTIEAKRQNKKGRASGGMLLATKKELKAKLERQNDGTISGKVNTRKEKWSIILTYMNKGKENNWRCTEDQVEDQTGRNKLILGDMNARTGEEGGSDIPEKRRNSKDTVKNTEGQKMLKKLEQHHTPRRNQRRRRREIYVHRSQRKPGN